MKRYLLFALALFLGWNVLNAAEKVQIGELYYYLDSSTKTATVTSPSSGEYSGSITIPSTVYKKITYIVTSIGDEAFNGCTGLTAITIPNSVTSIGGVAFYGCTMLTSITIPESVTSIGGKAFNNTAWYNYQHNGVIYINRVLYAYKGTMPQGTGIAIKEKTISISDGAFENCSNLTSIAIPNSVESIGKDAFSGCTGLISVTIPESVTSIGYSAFRECTGLTFIRMKSKTPPQCEIGSFSGVPEDIPVYVPCDKEAYQNNSIGWYFSNIIEEREYNAIVQPSANGLAETISYTCGNELTIQATADEHYHFERWSDGNTDNPRTLVVVQDTALTAIFAPNQYTIYANAENGRVEGAGLYDYGSMAALYAYADEHYHFTHWSDGNTDNPRVVPVEEDAAYTAVFAIDQFTITATAEGNGYVSGDGTYDYGVEVILYAIADEHYHFAQWSDGNTENPRTVSVDGEATYTAIFVPNQYTISATAENGYVEGTGEYDYGTTATLTAVANEHYHFTQWSDGNTDNPRTVSVDGNATYTAEFAIDRHTITTTCDIRYGEVTGDGIYDYGTRITLTAIPNSGYEFKQWSNGLSYNPYRFTVVSDLTLEAEFIPATAIDDIQADTDITPQKVLINGQVYILRNGKTYTLTGGGVQLGIGNWESPPDRRQRSKGGENSP